MTHNQNENDQDIDTKGGAYIEGGINISGDDFTGHKKSISQGDQVYGDRVHGDKVGGDKITVGGDISGSVGIAIGRGAQASVTQTQGPSGDEIVWLFKTIYERIEARAEDPDVDKEELAGTVQKIEQEAAKGEQANVKKVERWLGFLADMAPDILKVTAAALANPIAGVTKAIRLIAKKTMADT